MLHLRKKILKKIAKGKTYVKITDHCNYTENYRDVAHRICNLRFIVSTQIPVVCHNRSNYDYYFIIKELENKFKCLGEISKSTKYFPFQ